MKRKWILLGEDDPNDARLATMALADFSPAHEIVVVEDGAEVLERIYGQGSGEEHAQESPAVVLLDLKMPKVDGREILTRVKSDPAKKCIPIVMLTSSQREQDVKQCYQLGANGYLVKPIAFQQYKRILHDFAHYWLVVNEPPPESSK
jgi:CheY-like chemotaxis protein